MTTLSQSPISWVWSRGRYTSSRAVGRRRLVADAGCRTMRLVWNHALDLRHVGLIKHYVFIELAFALCTFRSQDVALIRVTALDLAGTCLLEALGRSAMCLQLWHSYLSITT